MLTAALAYTLGCLAGASLIMAWFKTELPMHFFHVLGFFGWQKENETFWQILEGECPEGMEDTGYTFLEDLSIALHSGVMPKLLADLLTCRYCISFHVSFWISLILFLLFPVSWLLIPAATLSWPILINILVSKS